MKQQELFERASRVMPAAGFGNFDPKVIISEGRGSRVWDEDNNFTDTDPPVQETAEQKINRLGARPTSFTSPSV